MIVVSTRIFDLYSESDADRGTRHVWLRGTEEGALVLEGQELRTLLLNLDEYEQMFHKVERRLRDARAVEILANVELRIDHKAEFQEEANLQPVFEAVKKLGLNTELRRDEEH